MKLRPTLLASSILVLAACGEVPEPSPTGPELTVVAAASCSLPVSLADAYAELAALRAEVDALEAAGALNAGQARALRNHLDNARRHLDAGRYCPALAQVRALREQVADFVAGGVIDGTEAAPLVEGADRILGTTPPPAALAFESVSAGRSHSCGVTTGGEAYCWGGNDFGQLGDGTTTDRLVPTPVLGGLTFTTVTVGQWHTCGLAEGGAAYCWGIRESGVLGDGTTTGTQLTPSAVSGGHSFAVLAAGRISTCGIETGTPGTAYCWGNNLFGQVGDGTFTDRAVPTPVGGGLAFDAISVGDGSACGLEADGSAHCWGANDHGQLGDGTTSPRRPDPAPVHGGLSFDGISAGAFFTCGIASGGASYCWGRNLIGQLGDGTTEDRHVPTPVLGGHVFDAIVAGDGHACALEPTGAAYCWGFNLVGSLGDGTTTERHEPTPVTGGLAFDQITAGGHTCGVAAAAAYCWGSNADGALGDGTTEDRHVPTPVSGPAG